MHSFLFAAHCTAERLALQCSRCKCCLLKLCASKTEDRVDSDNIMRLPLTLLMMDQQHKFSQYGLVTEFVGEAQQDHGIIMHLSMSSPTTPRTGTIGDMWGFDQSFFQISEEGGSF